MNQVHVIIGKSRTNHNSLESAFNSIRARVLLARLLDLVEDEVILMLKRIFQ